MPYFAAGPKFSIERLAILCHPAVGTARSADLRTTPCGAFEYEHYSLTVPTAEFRLAAACAMWPPSPQRTTAIRNAAARPLDWDRFQKAVAHHGLVGLAHEGLKPLGSVVPTNIAHQLAADAKLLVRQNLAKLAEVARLLRLFTEADLSVWVFKGVPL